MRGIVLFLFLLGILVSGGCISASQDQESHAGNQITDDYMKIAQTGELIPFLADGVITDDEYSGVIGDDNGLFLLYWRNDQGVASFGLVGRCEGWVAIGFNPTVRMKDADIVLGFVNDTEVTVLDAYATGPTGPHPIDTELGGSSDIKSLGGTENGDYTIIEFSRLLDTGNQYDAVIIKGEDMKIIWAIADSDIPDMRHNIARGSFEITL